MSGLVDPALDVLICSSIFVDDTAQVYKLLHLIQVFVVECDGVLFLVVYLHHLRLLGVDTEARLLQLLLFIWCLCERRLMSSESPGSPAFW